MFGDEPYTNVKAPVPLFMLIYLLPFPTYVKVNNAPGIYVFI